MLRRDRDHDRSVELGAPDHSLKPDLGTQALESMVVEPAGRFLMGTTDDQARCVVAIDSRIDSYWMIDEKPQHRVTLDAYGIDVTPVTVGAYRRFCEATGTAMPDAPPGAGWKTTPSST